MSVRRLLLLAVAASFAASLTTAAHADAPKVLRYAFEVAESSLDPAKTNDFYSKQLIGNIYDGLLAYDHLARPVKLKPWTAQELPVPSDDFTVWTIKLRPGIHFATDPAFKGQRRELVAQDYVYSIKRFADPASKSPSWGGVEADGIVGLAELRAQALKDKTPFDYDREIAGLRALDRYTLRITLANPRGPKPPGPAGACGWSGRAVLQRAGRGTDRAFGARRAAEGAALRVRGCRDQPRPGEDQ